jgi:hypothetical protein
VVDEEGIRLIVPQRSEASFKSLTIALPILISEIRNDAVKQMPILSSGYAHTPYMPWLAFGATAQIDADVFEDVREAELNEARSYLSNIAQHLQTLGLPVQVEVLQYALAPQAIVGYIEQHPHVRLTASVTARVYLNVNIRSGHTSLFELASPTLVAETAYRSINAALSGADFEDKWMEIDRAPGGSGRNMDSQTSESDDQWIWCYVCARCYRRDDAVPHGSDRMCGYYPDCTAYLCPDGWPWNKVRHRFARTGAYLPAIPEHGIAYLAYISARRRSS